MSGFQLKDFVSITASSLNQVAATQDRITDFEIGSVVRTLIEANAIEIEELYQKVFAGINDAIPTAIYKAFDFELVGPAAARGTVLVTYGTPIVTPFIVPAGTIFLASGGLRFASVADVAVAVDDTSTHIVIECSTAGAVGNISANAVTAAEGFSFPIGSTLSNNAFTSGSNGQTESERKARFVEFITSLSRGTLGAIRTAVRQTRIANEFGVLVEYVSRVGYAESPGHVDVFIYGSDGPPSAELLAAAQRTLDGYTDDNGGYSDGYRALGVEARVLPMVERVIPVSLTVTLLGGINGSDALRNLIATVLASEINAIESGTVLRIEQLTDAVLALTGVRKAISGNNENIVCGNNEVLVMGELTVGWSNA